MTTPVDDAANAFRLRYQQFCARTDSHPFVRPEFIKEQAALDWPDIHPEDYCHRCGQRNVFAWSTDANSWAIARLEEHEIVCPQCFTRAYADHMLDAFPIWSLEAE